MNAPSKIAVCSILAALAACSPPPEAKAPEPAKDAPAEPAPGASAAPSAPSAEPSAAADAPRAPAAESSPHEALARDLLKSGGRRIGYSASKKRFVVPIELRTDGGRGLDIRFFDDEGAQRENQRICQPGECEVKLDELVKDELPKLAARLEKEGYEAVYAIGWPSGRDELDINSLNLKLRYEKGKLTVPREKKPATPLRALGGRAPKTDELSAIYPVGAAKLLGVFAKGDKNAQDFFVFKLP